MVVIKPLSRGSILINSTDPFAPPVVDYGTFRHRTDLDIAVASLKNTRQYFASEPFQELGINEVFPGPAVTGDEELAEAIRGFATSTWSHPVGTLSMMRREYGGVVDPLLRVYGVRNLRVVDASIIPMTPASHTSSTVYAIAEKVSPEKTRAVLPLPRSPLQRLWLILSPRRPISSKGVGTSTKLGHGGDCQKSTALEFCPGIIKDISAVSHGFPHLRIFP